MFKLGNRNVGVGQPAYLVAGIGLNHQGKAELARQIIVAAKKAGADAVRVSVFQADQLASRTAEAPPHQRTGARSDGQLAHLRKHELSGEDLRGLKKFCDGQGIEFLPSVHDPSGLDFCRKIGVRGVKIPSGELTNLPLMEAVLAAHLPVFLSTGMGTVEEIRDAVKLFRTPRGAGFCLMHSVSLYPTPLARANIRAIPTLRETFGLPVGYSDHTGGQTSAIGAVALGACVIEKPLVLRRSSPSADQPISLTPEEFAEMVGQMRDLETSLGTGSRIPTVEESAMREFMRKSLVATQDIPRGASLTEEMVTIKRPGSGIPPRFYSSVIGLCTKKIIVKDEVVTWNKLDL